MSISLKARAYNHIRNGLLSGRWPEDSFLSPAKIAHSIGMSYTPVREAIIQLTGEGLLERNSDGAVALKKLTREELEDIYDLRIALESRAAELAAKRVRPLQIRKLRESLRTFVRYARDVKTHGYTREQAEVHLDATPRTDMTFHLLLMQASGSRQILKIVSDMHVLSHAHRHRVALHEGESFAQRCVMDALSHWRVFRAIEAHDAARAFAAMRRHLEDARQYHLDTFDRLQESKRQRESQIGEWSDEVLSLLSAMENGAATGNNGNPPAV
ncbi:MAG: GntR family transcriptional regulator [Phycisphaerae bacterium]|nr:GntR family transcriptional regulator [Phycisphaerae bacterium]